MNANDGTGATEELDLTQTGSNVSGVVYFGADEDQKGGDCYKWNDKDNGDKSNISYYPGIIYPYPAQAQIEFVGSATNPLTPPADAVEWAMNVIIDDSNPLSPQAFVNYNHTCYPAHIVRVNNTVVYEYVPRYNNPLYLGLCLTQAPGFGKVSGQQSVTKTVPVQ